jgi:hypothetical protein
MYRNSLTRTGRATLLRTLTGSLLMSVLLTAGMGRSARAADIPTAALQTQLEQAGFTVQQGKLETLDFLALLKAGLIPNALGNNPASPYLIARLPMGPGEPSTDFPLLSDAPIAPQNRGFSLEYRLRPDEAVVLVGKTPPPVDYFSYRSYVMRRYVPWEGKHERILASLGDSINNLTIATAGTPNGSAGDPFNQTMMIVSTADKGIDARIRAAANRAGYDNSVINTDVIPSTLVKMGWENDSDTFLLGQRLAFFKDPAAQKAYLADPGVALFRVTPKDSAPLDPFPVPALRVRGTGRTEFQIKGADGRMIDLWKALLDLRQAILARHATGNVKVTELPTAFWACSSYLGPEGALPLMEGYTAIQTWNDILGDNRDAAYLTTGTFTLGPDPGEYVLVYGVNHAATGKAAYANLGVYGRQLLNGVTQTSNHDYAGTAEAYLPGNPAVPYLYVAKVSRQQEPGGVFVPFGQGPYGIDLDLPAFITFRIYLEPETKVGPAWGELVWDRAIKFGPGGGVSSPQ